MRAVRCSGGSLEVVEVPPPAGEGVRVRIASAGICGSDLHLVERGSLRHTIGHEMAGVASDGTAVAVEPLLPCGRCEFCVSGEYHLCELGPQMLIGIGRDGGMADEVVVPERCLVRLPAGVAPRDACLIEPLAVAVHGLRKGAVRGGQRVAIVGAGSIGLCALAVARSAGAEVGLVARHDAQREAGERLGAHEAAGAYDLVVDAAGTKSALERALELCKPGGTLLLLATYWGGFELPGFDLCLKEVRVIPSSLYSCSGGARDIDGAAAILAARPAIAESLITHRFPLDAAPEAFRAAADRGSGAIKVVLEP